MSGVPCLIIIRGNRAQANTHFAVADVALHGQSVLLADQLIGGFQSLCSLGTTTYDGHEVMTDPQQALAASLMGDYNTAIEALLKGGPPNRDEIAKQIAATHAAVYQLLDAASQNP